MTNFPAEEADSIEDPTQGEQRRSTRDRQAARGPRLQRQRLTEAPVGSATNTNPQCSAVLMLAGRHFRCDLATDAHGRHDGWRHSSKAAEAIWCDDATTEWGDGPAVPLTLKDIGDMHGARGWPETAEQYWKDRAEAAEAALKKAAEQLERHQSVSDYELGYEHGVAAVAKAYRRIQAERDELRVTIARIEVLAQLWETVPSPRLIDALSSDVWNVPDGQA